MRHIINRIHKRTTEYSHPSQATTIANSLELLSSGIYTEEERFVFELLQNAVDSYDEATAGLNVKIVVGNGRLIFMHNGSPFSERDLEGLCDIGNGNKMSDAKKIGYKGIGFKSVFMHSKRVTVITDGTCFRFDEEACRELAVSRGKEYKDVKMPWQIIPIISEIPVGMNYDGYSVITILEVSNTEKLLKKVEKLLSDARFLLFLKVANLRVSLFDGETEILSLSKTQEKNILTLAKNNVAQSHWLMFAKDVKIPSDVKEDLIHDTKTPTKLKDSDSVEISFAIALDDEGHILPLKDAVVYTYLPTSFSFGFEFVVNANFITDAGRQQLIKDCEWNKFIFSQIPSLFLNWIKDEVAPNHSDWYKVLLPIKSGTNDLTISYAIALDTAISKIPFIRTLSKKQIFVEQALFDKIGFVEAVPTNTFDKFVEDNISDKASSDTLVDIEAYPFLKKYGVKSLSLSIVNQFLEETSIYLSNLSDNEVIVFLEWLYNFSKVNSNELSLFLKQVEFIPDEDNVLQSPEKLFFPSEYRNQIDLAENAKVIKESIYEELSDEILNWLESLGIKEISPLTIIDKVICDKNFITKDNAIEVIRYIFTHNKDNEVFKLPKSRLKELRFLTSQGTLKTISHLYLSNAYRPHLQIENLLDRDIFISDLYIKKSSEIADWSFFFQKLGINVDFSLNIKEISLDTVRNKNISFLSKTIEPSKKIGYESYNGNTYYFYPSYFEVNHYPLMPEHPAVTMWAFSKCFWSEILSKPKPKYKSESIEGASGFISRSLDLSYFTDGKYYFDWVLKNRQYFPTSMGNLLPCSQILENTESNIAIFGKYFPVLDISDKINQTWKSVLPFKKTLTLLDYLDVLERISEDDSKEQISDNIDRICKIIDRIADGGYNFTVGSSDFNTLRSWGKTHKILSADKKFEYPCDLCLISSRLSGVELDNQVYHRKNQENNRFADLMIALGVNMINDHRVEGLDDAIPQNSIKEELQKKLDFFTALSLGDKYTLSDWTEAKDKMREAIVKINFYNVPSIHVIYGTQSIEKPVYVRDTNLYFVGKFGLAIQELLHVDIVRLLGLHANDRSMFLTLLRMSDYDEMIEYLQLKGYDTELITKPQLPEEVEANPAPIMQGEDAPYGGLTTEQMRDALIEAKEAVLSQLEIDGYDISNYHWDGWTCIDGVKKGDIEYPLVIRSNRSGSNIRLNPNDWNQLMRPNAMFAMNTSDGIGTLRLKDILKSRENITIRFKSDNLDNMDHISKIADLLAYFRGIQFDFESYVRPTISRWQSFMAPELETGEQAVANTSIPLPE